MNLKRGFRRAIFVLSLLIALITAVLAFVATYDTCDYNRRMYYEYKNDYENITMFWINWDTDGWDVGQRAVVRHLLNSRTEYGGAEFVFGDKTVTLHCWDVFPGINEVMLSMPLDVLNKEAQTAKENALKRIEENLKSYDSWGKITFSGVILLAILAALGGAIAGYLGIWVLWFGGIAIYKFVISKFIKWLVQGFRDDTPEQVEKVEPIHKMKKIKQILRKLFHELIPPSVVIDEKILEETERLLEQDKEILERGLRPALIHLETGQDVFDTISRSEAHRFRLAVNICESNKQPTGKNFRVKWIGHVIALHIPTPYHKGGLELRWEDVKAHKECEVLNK
ncbi:MAG: hypothetical protein KAS75_08710 [Planctomycetes bacterium]|nr:hypothetical protein [Planctomycetota bacterium]